MNSIYSYTKVQFWIRNFIRYVISKYHETLIIDLKPVYGAVSIRSSRNGMGLTGTKWVNNTQSMNEQTKARYSMLEKLIVGRYLKKIGSFEDQCQRPKKNLPEHFIEAIAQPYSIAQSVSSGFLGVGRRTSEICNGKHPYEHRIFTWLPYIPGKVTYTREAGHAILTGKMSGCWIIRFQLNGVKYVAHIGTEESCNSFNTRQAYAAWYRAVSECGVTLTAAFNPIRSLNITQLVSLDKKLSKEFYSVIDAQGRVYTLVLGMSSHSTWHNGKKICAVYPVPSQPFVTGPLA